MDLQVFNEVFKMQFVVDPVLLLYSMCHFQFCAQP